MTSGSVNLVFHKIKGIAKISENPFLPKFKMARLPIHRLNIMVQACDYILN
jgi:hypothetical protein